MNDIIKIIKSLEDSSLLIDDFTETVKHEIKKQEGGFLGVLLAPLTASVVQPAISSFVKEQEEDIIITWIKTFSSSPHFKQYRDY